MKGKFYRFLTLALLCSFQLKAQPSIEINQFSITGGDCITGVSEILLIASLTGIAEPPYDYNLCVYYDAANNDTMNCYPIIDSIAAGVPVLLDQHPYEVPGSYVIKVKLMDNLMQNCLDSVLLYTDSLCMNSIQGHISFDEANNCTAGTPFAAPVTLRVDRNGLPVDTVYAYQNYSYTFSPNYTDSIYTITPVVLPEGFVAACPGAGNYNFVLDTLEPFYQLDFGVACPGSAYDLMTYASGVYKAFGVPSSSGIMIDFTNLSCITVDPILTLDIDPKYSFSSASITPSNIDGQTITWQLEDIGASSLNDLLHVQLAPNSAAIIDEIACSTVSVGPINDDTNPANNTYVFCDTIRSSWDPNNKNVSPAGDLAPGMELTYTLNFENLGNDTAFNVIIVDTLSDKLEYNTFELITGSHPVTVSHRYANDQKILTFNFPDIHLGDRNHPTTNKGFIMYRLNAATTIVPGDKVANTAYIYFDNNPAVITNTIVSTYPDPSTIDQAVTRHQVNIFPNPASDQLFILLEEQGQLPHEVVVVNVLGQELQRHAWKGNAHTISISQLASGVYFLKFPGRIALPTLRFIKD